MKNKLIIDNFKAFIKTSKPLKDKYGTITRAVTLNDHVLYALLREKKDFRTCSQDKSIAIDMANGLLATMNNLLSDKELKLFMSTHRMNHLKDRLGKDLNHEHISEIKLIIEKQINVPTEELKNEQ